jgi:transcriptional regulator with XRE-family HTH domain
MEDATESQVGKMILKLRKQRDLSLRALAERCELSITAISKIERGENSPTVASLHQLSKALEVPITDFFQQDLQQHIVFVKESQAAVMQTDEMSIESLGSGLPQQKLEPLKLLLSPGKEQQSDPVSHSGEEFVYCLKGMLEYIIGDQNFVLEPGDRLLFKAAQPHCWRVLGSEEAEFLLVMQPDENQPSPH